MKRGLFFKNFVVTMSIFVICFLVFGLAMLMMGRMYLVQERKEILRSTAQEVKRLAEAVVQQDELTSLELRMSLAAIAQSNGEHIFLCDAGGVVVTSSDTERVSPYVGMRLSDDLLPALRQGSYETLGRLGDLYDEPHHIVIYTLEKGGAPAGYVVVSYEARVYLQVWNSFILIFVLVAVGVLMLAVLFQFFYSRTISRPLYEMAEAANRYAKGDYSARVSSCPDDDEIGTLTEAFNGMAESLELNETRRRDFVANVSHELRTPMTTIAGFADGILDGTIPPDQQRKYLETISSETKRLSRLVRTMLDMSRLRADNAASRMTVFDLNEMVVQAVLSFEERVEAKKLNMMLDMPEEGPRVTGDLDALTRVVYNLVDNAIKFADEGTDLTVSVWKENGMAYTSVQDHGVTIPRSELPLIFDRFHKSDRSRSMDRDGVGLGLYMVKEIIAAHGQEIFVTSENGVTAFTFTLALAEEKEK